MGRGPKEGENGRMQGEKPEAGGTGVWGREKKLTFKSTIPENLSVFLPEPEPELEATAFPLRATSAQMRERARRAGAGREGRGEMMEVSAFQLQTTASTRC